MNERDTKFAEIGRVLREHNKFAVLSHVRPDGDALGSTLALALSLKGLGKEVRAWNEEGMLEKYNFLAQAELLTQPPSEPEDFDVVVALDTAVQNRLGSTTSAVRHAKLWINIDHHPSNPRYGDLVYIDPTAPATGQILFEFLTNQNFPITPEIAENLYAAISTDTGSFQYPNTTVRTFEIAAELVRCGVEVGRISQLLYENFPRRRIELLRELLGTMQFGCDGKLAWFSLSQAAALALGVIPEDNEGLIDHLRAISRRDRGNFLRRTARWKSARQHALEKRSGRCLRDLYPVWWWRPRPRRRSTRPRDIAGSREKNRGTSLCSNRAQHLTAFCSWTRPQG